MAFVKFTLGDIRTSVRRKLDDSTFDAATIDEAANDFQFELFNDNRIRFMEETANLAIGSGVTSKDLPAYFIDAPSLVSGTPDWHRLRVQEGGTAVYAVNQTAAAGGATSNYLNTETGDILIPLS